LRDLCVASKLAVLAGFALNLLRSFSRSGARH
jgi:hypothetical protein